MKLKLTPPPEQALDDQERTRLLRETIRAELAARGPVTRRWLVARVSTSLQLSGHTEEEVGNAIDDLEAADDLVSGSGGRIAPAPLRVIDAHGRFLLVGTLPSVEWRLKQPLKLKLDEQTLPRRVEVGEGDRQHLADLVAGFDGIVIPLERWAGLDRVSAADTTWLAELDARLSLVAEAASDDPQAHWKAFMHASDGELRTRWRMTSTVGPHRLWRRFLRAGYPEQGWTRGESPATSPWLRVNGDDALRTAYALSREHHGGFDLVPSGDRVELTLKGRIPRAEYRWLVGCAEELRDHAFILAGATAQRAQDLLQERLGIKPSSAGH